MCSDNYSKERLGFRFPGIAGTGKPPFTGIASALPYLTGGRAVSTVTQYNTYNGRPLSQNHYCARVQGEGHHDKRYKRQVAAIRSYGSGYQRPRLNAGGLPLCVRRVRADKTCSVGDDSFHFFREVISHNSTLLPWSLPGRDWFAVRRIIDRQFLAGNN
jgi:hypothetical protein